MIIYCDDCDLKWKNFDIVNFYGVETCFVWNNEKLVIFPYNYDDIINRVVKNKLSVIVTPKPIKSIHNYSGRIFIVFKPCGIYKFNKNYKFVILSSTGIDICEDFYHILKLKDNYLYLINICDREWKKLLKLTSVTSDIVNINEVCVLVIRKYNNTVNNKLKSIISLENNTHDYIYIIANGGNLYKICGDCVQLIYNCKYNIINVTAINRQNETIGLLLKTDLSIIIIGFVNNNKLYFREINLNSIIITLIVELFDDNTILILHGDNDKVHIIKLKLELEVAIDNIGSINKKIIDLKCNSGKILALTNINELIYLDVNMTEYSDNIQSDNYYELKSNMLKESEIIVDNIAEQTKQLNVYNGQLLIEQDKLKRVNIYAYKKQLSCLPKIIVNRTANCLFLKVTFDHSLPQHTNIIVNLTSGNQTQFSSKFIDDREITVEMLLLPEILSMDSTLNVSIDLVTFSEANNPWCIINNCIKESTLRDRTKIRQLLIDKKNFINAKLRVLRNIAQDNNCIIMKKLCDIKKSIRRDIPTDL